MTTPAMPRTAPGVAAVPATADTPVTSDKRLDAIAAAVSAIACHLTGSGDERQALTRFGLTSEQADTIASTTP